MAVTKKSVSVFDLPIPLTKGTDTKNVIWMWRNVFGATKGMFWVDIGIWNDNAMVTALKEAEFFQCRMQDGTGPYAIVVADYEEDCWRLVRKSDPRSIKCAAAIVMDECVYEGLRHKWVGFWDAWNQWIDIDKISE